MKYVVLLIAASMLTSSIAEAREEPTSPSAMQIAERIITASELGDDAAMETALGSYAGDALDLCVDVLIACVRADRLPEVDREQALAFIGRIAGAWKDAPAAPAMKSMHKRLTSLDGAAWKQERAACVLIGRLKRLVEGGAPRAAIDLVEKNGQAWDAMSKSCVRWRLRFQLSEALAANGDLAKSRSLFRRLGAAATEVHWHAQAATAYRAAAIQSHALKDRESAVQDEDLWWAAASASKSPSVIQRAGLEIAGKRIRGRRTIGAMDILAEVEKAARQRDDKVVLNHVLTWRWRYYDAKADEKGALKISKEQAAFARERGNVRDEQEALYQSAVVLYALGRFAEALDVIQRALALRPEDPKPITRFELLQRAGLIKLMLGRKDEALVQLQEATGIAIAHGWRAKEIEARVCIISIHESRGEFEQAESKARATLEMLDPKADVEHMTGLVLQLGMIAERKKEWEKAEAHYDRLLTMESIKRNRPTYNSVRMLRAGLDVHRGHFEDGLIRLRALREEPSDSLITDAVREELFAQAAIGAGKYAEALKATQAAIETHLKSFEGLPPGLSLSRQWRTSRLARLGLVAATHEIGDGRGARAPELKGLGFWFFEVSRALQLTQALRTLRAKTTLPPKLAAADKDSRARLQRAQKRMSTVATFSVSDERRLAATSDLEAAWAERDRVVAAIEGHSRRDALVSRLRPIGLESFQAALPDDSAYVAFDTFHEEGIIALVVTQEDVNVLRLGPAGDLKDAVDSFRRRLSLAKVDASTMARSLYDRLIAPIEKAIGGVHRLYISPDGALAALPFAALKDGDGSWLMEKCETTLVPSATSLFALRQPRPPGRGLFAVANPPSKGDYPDLPASEREVANVSKHFAEDAVTVLKGKQATVGAVGEAYGANDARWRVAHFACHAVLNAKHAERSGLVLADSDLWTASAVATMRAPTDVVVLSACNTARGVPAWGEGLLGLSRAFLWSGARQVVASVWRIEDKAGEAFFSYFYDSHLGKGLDAPAALRAAQRAMINSGGGNEHPSRWAAFVLWD